MVVCTARSSTSSDERCCGDSFSDQTTSRMRLYTTFSGILLTAYASWTWSIFSVVDRSEGVVVDRTDTNNGIMVENINRKPIALLHFGNRKTATTSIQDMLANGITDLLAEDGFVYYGNKQKSFLTGPKKYLKDCIVGDGPDDPKTTNDGSCPLAYLTAWKEWELSVEEHFLNGTNVVYSNEDIPLLTSVNPRALDATDALFANFDRRVTVSFRIHVDWLISEYNQQQKQRTNRMLIEGFVDWHRSTGVKKERLTEPLTKRHLDEYERRFDKVAVFNLHDPLVGVVLGNGDGEDEGSNGVVSDPVMVGWLCTMMPWATRTCQAAKDETPPQMPRDNPSDNALEARRLAQLALSDGWKNIKKLRKMSLEYLADATTIINAWIESFHDDVGESHGRSLPRTCLTKEEQDKLWHDTVQGRDDLVPGWDPTNQILKEHFDKARPKLCQLDYDAISSDNFAYRSEWKVIVSNIRRLK